MGYFTKDVTSKKAKIVDILNLPKDVMLDIPIMYIEGKDSLHIENYKGIIEYNDNTIRIKTKVGIIKLIGTALYIELIESDEIIIKGILKSIIYE